MSLFQTERTRIKGASRKVEPPVSVRSDLFAIAPEVLAATADELLAYGWDIERHLIPKDFKTKPRPMSSAEKKWLRKPLDAARSM